MKFLCSSKISLMLIGLLGLSSVSPAAEGTWTTKTDMPTGRWSLFTSVVDGKIYAIGGGRVYGRGALRTVEAYDPATDTWTTKSEMPTARQGLSTSVVNGKIYAIGGGEATSSGAYDGMEAFSTVEEYDPATDTWTTKSEMPTARAWHSASVVDARIYVIAGSPSYPWASILALDVYDPATDTWTRKGDIPGPRYAGCTSVVDGKIYAFGGYVGRRRVDEYDPVTDTWTQKADMPTYRVGLSTSVLDGKIHAIGGHPGSSPYPGITTVDVYDPATDAWTTAPDMPTGRWGVHTSVVDGKIYAIGGLDNYPAAACGTVEEYTPPSPVIDFNGDKIVDFKDFSILAQYWQQNESSVDIGPPPFGDGIIDFKDVAVFAENWLLTTRQASNPNPADDATGIGIDADLSWTPGDGAALHEVYFGSDPFALPLVATQPVGQESYDPPGDLIRSTTYYWRIDEVSDAGPPPGNWPGVLWSFTTVSGQAGVVFPADDAVIPGGESEYPPDSGNWYIWTKLIFGEGPTAVKHTGYFSEDYNDVVNRVQDANLGPPPYGSMPGYETTYYAGLPVVPPATESLVRGKMYYWCVDETDADGRTFPGDIWEFGIQGYKAFNPNPPDEAEYVDPNVVLSWGKGLGVQEHDIYFGTSWDDVNSADDNDTTGIYRGCRSDPNYPCSNLELTTKFFWRIDEVQGRLPPLFPGIIYKGDVWSFTTGVPPPP